MKHLLLIFCAVTISFSQWQQIPGIDGGVVMAFAGSGDTVFAGTKGGGIFRTFDGGLNWQMVNKGISNFDIEVLAAKDSMVYAGGYANTNGFFVSTNFGTSWIDKSSAFDSRYIKGIAVHDSIVLAGTVGYGLFRSSDAGMNWTKIDSGLTTSVVSILLYNNGVFYAGTNLGAFISLDNGISWTKRTSDQGKINIQAMAVKDSLLFAGTKSAVYLSVDSGTTWIDRTGYLPYSVIYSLGFKDNLLLAGTNGSVCYSADYGKTWGTPIINNGMTGYTVTPAIFVNGNKVFAATMNDVYVSVNNGINWTLQKSGINADNSYALFSDGENLFANIGSTSIKKSTNNGVTWTPSDSGFNAGVVKSFYRGSSTMLAGRNNGGIYYSTNNGSKWNLATVTPAANHIVSGWTTIGTTLYFSEIGKGVFKSTDDGKTWTNPIADNILSKSVWSITSLDTILFAGTAAGLYKSTNGGVNWIQVNSGNTTLQNSFISATTVFNGKLFIAAYTSGIFFSSDSGTTWKTRSIGLSGPVTAFYSNGTQLFAYSDKDGISVYKDSTWKSYNTGLLNRTINSVVFVGDTMFAGTSGMGIWKRATSEIVSSVHQSENSFTPKEFSLEQNFPNPFNPSTAIGFYLHSSGFASLKVYDVVGREVTMLVNENLKAGHYSVNFDATQLSSGIYFYVLRSGNAIEIKKMMLIR